MPIGAADRAVIHAEVREIFLRIGCDIDNHKDIASLQDALRWISEEQEKRKGRIANRVAFIWSAIAALFGAVATVTLDWLIRLRDHH